MSALSNSGETDNRGRSASELVQVVVKVMIWENELEALRKQAAEWHMTANDVLAGGAMACARQIAGTDDMGRPRDVAKR